MTRSRGTEAHKENADRPVLADDDHDGEADDGTSIRPRKAKTRNAEHISDEKAQGQRHIVGKQLRQLRAMTCSHEGALKLRVG